ncbi:AraC family transcriptional regulator [Desemzia sp. RIT 804]|uniref:helix-turn-helix domain-containing protein n=1 Tax=Desemzia sp. RIT 804 TaxID=2810209 RepID=UPI001F2C43C2|nr:AraC family transcriptional regulator [Desemzia sp. RIT 804]
MRKIPDSSVFKRYLGSYLLVFSIPFIIFLITVNTIYVKSIREELTSTNQTSLEQASLQLDEQIMEMDSVGNQINYTRNFIPHSLGKNEEYSKYVEQLKVYDNSIRSTKGIYIIINNHPTIFSSKGTMSLSALMNNTSDFDITEKDRLMEEFMHPAEKISVYTLNKFQSNNHFNNKVVYYTMPLEGTSPEYGVILFVMNTNSLKVNLEAMGNENERITFVADEKENLLFSNGEISQLSESDILSKMPDIMNKETTQIKQKDFTLNTQSNLITGWTFVSLIETVRFYRPLYRVLFIFAVATVLLILVGMGISFYFAIKNYQPIKRLTSSFSAEEEKIKDEWMFIQTNIKRTRSEYDLLNHLVNEQAPIVRNSALLNLIEGKYLQGDKFIKGLKDVGINFPFPLFAVLILELGEKSVGTKNIINIEKIVQKLKAAEENPDGYIIEATIPHFKNNQIFVILNMKEENETYWSKISSFIKEKIESEDLPKNEKWKIAVGNTYDSLIKIKNSYIEASSTLEQMNSSDSKASSILFFKEVSQKNEITKPTDMIHYPNEEMLILTQSIKQGNKETALETVESLFCKIEQYAYQVIAVQAVVADVFNTVFKLAIDLEIDNHYEQVSKLADFSNKKESKKVLYNIVISICNSINERQTTESIKTEQRVVQFIYQNYDSPDVSLERIASENNISISYASKLIKEETGKSFSSTVQSLRMGRFKELLLTTREPIQELVKQIGYYDVSNFTRKFRKENGVTPGEYRKRYQESN